MHACAHKLGRVPADYEFSSNRYWALDPAPQLAKHVLQRYRDWRKYLRDMGHTTKALNGFRYHHGWNRLGESAAAISLGGEKRDYLRMVVNEVRVMVQHVLAMLAGRVPEMQPVAASRTPGAMEETIAARDILEHVHREQRVDSLHAEIRKLAFLMGEAYRLCLWDGNKGEPVAADTGPDGQPVAALHQGDFNNSVCSMLDVARDPTVRNWDAVSWVVIRTWENKHVLAANRPEEEASRIRSISWRGLESIDLQEDLWGMMALNTPALQSGDTIPVYHFFHADNPAAPGGIAFSCLSDGLWLGEPTGNPYPGLPVKRLSPDSIHGTTLGDTNVFDVTGLCDAVNILYSTWITNAARWGIGTIAFPKQSSISRDSLGNGSTALEYTPVAGAANGGMPTPIVPPGTPQDVVQLAQMLVSMIAKSLGLNDTAVGNLPFAGMPAALVAQMIQVAQQFQDTFYGAIVRFESDCATHELNCLKLFAKDSRTYEVMGESQRWMAKEFTGDTLKGVSRVAFEPAPAVANSLAGRQMQLQAMTEMAQVGGPISFPGIVDFFMTGRMPAELSAVENLTIKIARMQEQLRAAKYLPGPDGQPLPVMDPMTGAPALTDSGQPQFQIDPASLPKLAVGMKVWTFIDPLLSLLDEEHDTPAVMEAVLATVTECMQIWESTPPQLLALLGAPPMPAGGMPPPGSPSMGAPPPPMPPQGAGPMSGTPQLPPGPPQEAPAALPPQLPPGGMTNG